MGDDDDDDDDDHDDDDDDGDDDNNYHITSSTHTIYHHVMYLSPQVTNDLLLCKRVNLTLMSPVISHPSTISI